MNTIRRIPPIFTSKVIILLVGLLLILGITTGPGLAQGSDYDLGWWTTDGGGGQTSGNNGYTLHGTAGQADAGTLSGNDYTLVGGFWGGEEMFAVYVPLVIK